MARLETVQRNVRSREPVSLAVAKALDDIACIPETVQQDGTFKGYSLTSDIYARPDCCRTMLTAAILAIPEHPWSTASMIGNALRIQNYILDRVACGFDPDDNGYNRLSGGYTWQNGILSGGRLTNNQLDCLAWSMRRLSTLLDALNADYPVCLDCSVDDIGPKPGYSLIILCAILFSIQRRGRGIEYVEQQAANVRRWVTSNGTNLRASDGGSLFRSSAYLSQGHKECEQVS
jgi:hypothetical protein